MAASCSAQAGGSLGTSLGEHLDCRRYCGFEQQTFVVLVPIADPFFAVQHNSVPLIMASAEPTGHSRLQQVCPSSLVEQQKVKPLIVVAVVFGGQGVPVAQEEGP